jgi:hypothetical protein
MGIEGDRRRNDAKAKGNQLLAEGKKTQARDAFVKAVDVTPEMAYQLIKVRCRLFEPEDLADTSYAGAASRRDSGMWILHPHRVVLTSLLLTVYCSTLRGGCSTRLPRFARSRRRNHH